MHGRRDVSVHGRGEGARNTRHGKRRLRANGQISTGAHLGPSPSFHLLLKPPAATFRSSRERTWNVGNDGGVSVDVIWSSTPEGIPPETRSILEASHPDRTVAGEIFFLHRTLSAPRAKDPLSARGELGSLSTSRTFSAVADGRCGTDSLPRLRARDPYCRNGKRTGDAHRPFLSSRICDITTGTSRSRHVRSKHVIIQRFWSVRLVCYQVCDSRFLEIWSLRSKIPRSRSFSPISDATTTGFIGGANRGNRDRYPTRLARRRRHTLLRPVF